MVKESKKEIADLEEPEEDNTHDEKKKEKWKVVPRFEGYEASNIGRVRKRTGKIIKPTMLCNKVVIRISLKKMRNCENLNCKYLISDVDIIILLAHGISPKDAEQCVRHKDGDEWNCCIENLEWIDSPKKREIIRIDVDTKEQIGPVYPSIRTAAADNNTCEPSVADSCKFGKVIQRRIDGELLQFQYIYTANKDRFLEKYVFHTYSDDLTHATKTPTRKVYTRTISKKISTEEPVQSNVCDNPWYTTFNENRPKDFSRHVPYKPFEFSDLPNCKKDQSTSTKDLKISKDQSISNDQNTIASSIDMEQSTSNDSIEDEFEELIVDENGTFVNSVIKDTMV